ncbi:unnamed protein product [Hymenolepis diminuta]|uniref:Uncharacterized protein n=1 Tax=Hymenolepis diminuta TaxID=6216 RepID=A0A564YQ94_HYMDI|nr:unnamed protein product [Hymenolepis diminuta]
MLASISAGYNSLFGNKESCENIENSEHSNSSDTGFSQPSCASKSPMSSPELSRGIRYVESPSTWSFTEASCSMMQGFTAEDVFLDNSKKKQQPISPAQSPNTSRSMPNQLDTLDMITLDTRCRSADFTLTTIEDMIERPDSLRTLGDASRSSFPLDSQQRSVSTSTTSSDPSNRRAYVTALVKRRREIEEDLAELNVKLLESYREEWILTGVIPEGFAEIQSQVFAFDPKLKTTSFPLTHLLPNSRSETNFKTPIVDKPFTMSLQLSSSERDSGIHNSVEENSAAFNYKDSLTSSFSSVMADSFYFSQSDDASLRTCSFIENSAREAIVKRLEELKNDFAVVNQIYLIHRQRAFETNQSAFRKACKCNVQKLKEIQQEKLALEAKLREIEASEQLSCVGCSRLCRSTSVSVKEDCYIPVTATSTVATLPRRKTLRIPSLSHSGTLRLGKLRKHPNVKQVEFENTPQTPIIGSAKPVKSGGLRHVPSSLRGLRFQLLPARLRMPRSQTIVQRVHLDPVSSSQVRGIPTDDSNTLRPQSMYATVYSSRVCNSMDDLRKAQLQKHFSASGPNLLDVNGSEQSSNLGDKISPMVPTGDSELTGMFGDLNISTSGVTPKDTTSPTDSDGQSTSGAFSMTSQEFSLLGETEVCLRRPMKVSPEESPIRCICSCISDHGDGNCDCFEESCEDCLLFHYPVLKCVIPTDVCT